MRNTFVPLSFVVVVVSSLLLLLFLLSVWLCDFGGSVVFAVVALTVVIVIVVFVSIAVVVVVSAVAEIVTVAMLLLRTYPISFSFSVATKRLYVRVVPSLRLSDGRMVCPSRVIFLAF